MDDFWDPNILATMRRVAPTIQNRATLQRLRKRHEENAAYLIAMPEAAKWNHRTWAIEWNKSRDIVLAIDTILAEKEWPTFRKRTGLEMASWDLRWELDGGGSVEGRFTDEVCYGQRDVPIPSDPEGIATLSNTQVQHGRFRHIKIDLKLCLNTQIPGYGQFSYMSVLESDRKATDYALRSPATRELRHTAARVILSSASEFITQAGYWDYSPKAMAKALYAAPRDPVYSTSDGVWKVKRHTSTTERFPFLQTFRFLWNVEQ